MDINTILILQEEQQLAVQQSNEKNDQIQAVNSHFSGALAIDYLKTAATQAHTIASTLPAKHSAISVKIKAPADPSKTSTPSHKIASTGGGNGPGSSWTPNYPPANGDVDPPQGPTSDPTVPPYPTNADQPGSPEGYYDKLMQFLMNLKSDPNDLAQGQIFLQYLQNLSADGLLNPGSLCANALQNLSNFDGGVSIFQLIDKYIDANAELAYFEGYTTPSGKVYPPGNGAAQAWIATQMGILNGLGNSNPFTQEMQNELTADKQWFMPNSSGISLYDQSHKDANGYYMNIAGGVGKVYWNPSETATAQGSGWNPNFLIYAMIAGSSQTQTPDPTMDKLSLNGLNRQYEMTIVNELIAKYKNDPSLLLTMFILSTTANECDSQLSGQSDQTDRQTLITNQMSALTQSAGTIGTMTAQNAMQFVQSLYMTSGMVNTFDCTQSYASAFNSSVSQAFWGINIPSCTIGGKKYTNITMQQAFNYCYPNGLTPGAQPSSDWANVINSINPSLPSNQPGSPPTPPGSPAIALQTFLNSLQQGAAMVSQQSKTISTISASISNLLDQVLKVLGFDLNPSSGGGGGFTALVGSIVGNDISH